MKWSQFYFDIIKISISKLGNGVVMKIFLTSDVHIGMKFAGYPDIQEKLVNARFDALKKSIITANKNDCELFVVGGDLFDRVSVAKKDIQRAAAILSEFEGHLVAVLPGNHDFITPKQENLWTNFQSFADNNILLLQTCDVYPLKHFDIDANLYPAPCESKHSNENRIGWIKAVEKDSAVEFHIGVAHGSLEGVSPDFNRDYYPMKESELMTCGIDIWLMGHTHRAYPENPGPKNKIFYPGTAEPDGFDCDHRGNALIIQLDNEKNILATPIETGTYRFLHEDKTLKKWENIKSLLSTYLHLLCISWLKNSNRAIVPTKDCCFFPASSLCPSWAQDYQNQSGHHRTGSRRSPRDD